MDLLDGLRAFVATAETGSFSGAAERLHLSNRLTSKYVAELEARLGVRLFQRTTRKVGLTPAGEELLARAPALLEEVDELLGRVGGDARGFTGTLRISAPVNFGESHLAGMLYRFAAPHPLLRIDLRLSDAHVDLAAEGVDLAFRIGDPAQQALKARRLGMIVSQLVAAPAYLAARGVPRRPGDLLAADCIVDTNRRQPFRWAFQREGVDEVVTVRSRFMVNSARAARDLAVAGAGVAYCPLFVLQEDLAAGRLVPLLSDWQGSASPINAVYLEGRGMPRKLRALIDFAQKEFREAGLAKRQG